MPDSPTSPTPDPTLFAEDSLVSRSHRQEDSSLKTTPDISGLRCLELSGNSGPLGLLERTLLGSSNWAWTKYSLTWKAKATPQGRLIFQLARLAPRTSDNGSGLLHTPTAKANQTAPSMATRGSGNWVSTLWRTPMAADGTHNHCLAPSVISGKTTLTLTNQVKGVQEGLWPTPTTTEAKSDTHNVQNRIDKDKQVMLCHAVRLYPTPVTPTGGGERSGDRAGTGTLNYMARSGQLTDQKSGGSLNPMWVAWLMGYPTEYLNSVPWETASSRRSRKKSDKQ